MFGSRTAAGVITAKNEHHQQKQRSDSAETAFVRALNWLFRLCGKAIACHPWLYIGASVLLTLFCSSIIPFTPMTNDVSDFTPYGARARKEIETYEAFFSNKGDPIVVYVLITAKRAGRNMLGVRELGEAVRLLNIVSAEFTVYNSRLDKNVSFSEFCDNFCTINEPVRHFHSGLQLERNFGNSSIEHIDLGYPITTVLGRQLHMDPHFFGVRVAVPSTAAAAEGEAEQGSRAGNNGSAPGNGTVTRSVNELMARSESGAQRQQQQQQQSTIMMMFESASSQLPNNIREIKVVGLQFRAERPEGISKESIANWERAIVRFVRDDFQSDFVVALVLSETLLTDEVVRAGLTLLPFLVIGFLIMVVFSSLTMSIAAFYMGQFGVHKLFLAVIACCCPFMACGTALGAMFWLGFRFGSLLCVTPFLVLALGVDDAYLMLNSWQRLKHRMDERRRRQRMSPSAVDGDDDRENLRRRRRPSQDHVAHLVQRLMADVMVDTGASITITTLTNVLAFAIGAMTPTPEIRLFSIGNALAITTVYIYQWTVFGSAMALFGQREHRRAARAHQLPRTLSSADAVVIIGGGGGGTTIGDKAATKMTTTTAATEGEEEKMPTAETAEGGAADHQGAAATEDDDEHNCASGDPAIGAREDEGGTEKGGDDDSASDVDSGIVKGCSSSSTTTTAFTTNCNNSSSSSCSSMSRSGSSQHPFALFCCCHCFCVSNAFRRNVQRICSRLLGLYCRALTNCWVAAGVLVLLALYMYASIYGVLSICAELKPEQLFLRTSDVQRILRLRDDYIMPFYAVCMVFVNRPGNFSDPAQRRKLHSLVSDFESLPSSVGRFSTKFWLRDYEQFVESGSSDEAPLDDLVAFEGIPPEQRRRDELREFLQWPEFQFWNGFIRLENDSTNADNDPGGGAGELRLSRFFFTTASYGAELREWSRREQLLSQWRRVADSYPELEVSIYEDEAKFLDLIPTMVPQTVQSSLCTLFCMFLVCLLFMRNPGALVISNFAIFSTCIGVFGIQSLFGTALDPIFMSAAIMSIGFSVDMPAHIAYHFYKTGVDDKAKANGRSVEQRLQECLGSIGFPVLEAGISTLICNSSLFFVDLHMSRVFACTMTLVVSIGLVHALLVIPVLLLLLSNSSWPPSLSLSLSGQQQQQPSVPSTTIWPVAFFGGGRRKNWQQNGRRSRSPRRKSSKRPSAVMPIVLAVNQHDRF